MSQHVLTESGEILSSQTLRSLTQNELDSPSEQEKRERMNDSIRNRYGDSKSVPDNWIKRRRKPGDVDQQENAEDEVNVQPTFYEDETTGKAHEMPEADDIPDLDKYHNVEVLLPYDGEYLKAAQVVGRSTDPN